VIGPEESGNESLGTNDEEGRITQFPAGRKRAASIVDAFPSAGVAQRTEALATALSERAFWAASHCSWLPCHVSRAGPTRARPKE